MSKTTKKPRGNPQPSHKAPEGDANPQSYKSLQEKAARLKEVEAENVELRKRLEGVDRFAGQRDPDGGVTDPARMRRVLGQPKDADLGPVEAILRQMLEKDPRTYIAAIEEKERAAAGLAGIEAEVKSLRSENAELRKKRVSEVDVGTEEAEVLIDRILAEHF